MPEVAMSQNVLDNYNSKLLWWRAGVPLFVFQSRVGNDFHQARNCLRSTMVH